MTHYTLQLNHARAEISCFDTGHEVREYHVMLHAEPAGRTFRQQLDAITSAFDELCATRLQGAMPVLKRYFLSDVANQGDSVLQGDSSGCAVSIVGQPPLDGSKVALWAYLMTDVTARRLPSGLFEVCHGLYRHLWLTSAHGSGQDSEHQTRQAFTEYILQLSREGCTLADHCLRTWLFVSAIDVNYAGVVAARNHVFSTQGLTDATHFIASTGIGGSAIDPRVLMQMDAYAVDGLREDQIHYLYAPTHLNRTSDYGVSFERGTYVDYPDRRQVFISGTASIDARGQIVHPGDVISQTRRMWENVEALLAEAHCSYDDVSAMIVYLRDIADYAAVRALYDDRFPGRPVVFVHAPVCRPGWLVEMECVALKENKK